MKENKTKGIIREIIENNSENKRAPKGFIYLKNDNRKFTVWDNKTLKKILIGGEYLIEFEEKENEFNLKKYINYNIKNIEDTSICIKKEKICFNDKEIEEISNYLKDTEHLKKGESNNGFCILGRKIIIEEGNIIKLPREVYYYLIELMKKNGKDN